MKGVIIWLTGLAALLGVCVLVMRRKSPFESDRAETERLREQLRDSHDRLSSEIDILRESRSRLIEQVAQVQGLTDRLDPQIENLIGYLEQASGRMQSIDDLKSSMEIVAGKVAAKQQRAQSVIDGLDHEYRNMREQVGNMETIGRSLTRIVGQLQEQQQNVSQGHNALDIAGTALAERNQYISNRSESFAGTVEGMQAQSQSLTHLVQELKQLVDNLDAVEHELTTHALEIPEQQRQYHADRTVLLDGLRRLTELAAVYETSKEDLADEIGDKRSVIERLEGRLASLEQRLSDEQQQYQETKATLRQQQTSLIQVQKELDLANAENAHLELRVKEPEADEGSSQGAGHQQWFLRPRPQSFDELVEAVHNTFPMSIALPQTAVAQIGEFKSIADAQQLAGDVWRAIGAMHEYATLGQRYNGNFYDWCRLSGHTRAYPPGDVAMNESDTTKNFRNRSKHSREFYVNTQVSRSGRIEMYAHVKFGGIGQNRPRLYFYDDTSGKTRKIHIGFLGPHNEVKNSGSN